jgi:hypothetical protein
LGSNNPSIFFSVAKLSAIVAPEIVTVPTALPASAA